MTRTLGSLFNSKKYGVGDKFHIGTTTYALNMVSGDSVILSNIDSGMRWDDAMKVKNPLEDLSCEELRRLFSTCSKVLDSEGLPVFGEAPKIGVGSIVKNKFGESTLIFVGNLNGAVKRQEIWRDTCGFWVNVTDWKNLTAEDLEKLLGEDWEEWVVIND